jgi:phosphatidylglycerophosphate synthase
VTQQVAVGLALAPPVAEGPVWIADVTLWIAVALTLITGAQYFHDGSRAAAPNPTA